MSKVYDAKAVYRAIYEHMIFSEFDLEDEDIARYGECWVYDEYVALLCVNGLADVGARMLAWHARSVEGCSHQIEDEDEHDLAAALAAATAKFQARSVSVYAVDLFAQTIGNAGEQLARLDCARVDALARVAARRCFDTEAEMLAKAHAVIAGPDCIHQALVTTDPMIGYKTANDYTDSLREPTTTPTPPIRGKAILLAAPIINAITAVVDNIVDRDQLDDFGCRDVDAFATLYAVLGRVEHGATLIVRHGEHDDIDDDLHYDMGLTDAITYVKELVLA